MRRESPDTAAGSDTAARDRRVREATRWFVERESGRKLSTAELRQWNRWSADPQNKKEYDELCLLREAFRSLPSPMPSEAELQADSVQIEDDSTDESVSNITVLGYPGHGRPRPKWNFVPVSAAAAILVLVGAAFMVSYAYWRSSEDWRTYANARAQQQRVVTLADGSIVTLAADTELRASVAKYARVAILSRGEALFRVNRSAQQPFTVRAQNGSIQALGTVFDVRNYSDRVQVTVTEGLVQVSSEASQAQDLPFVDHLFATAKKPAAVKIRQGQAVSYRTDGSTTIPQAADLARATEWTQGRITYNGEPLREIIEDVQRYYTRPIKLDQAVANLNYTGMFPQRKPDAWLRSLPVVFPLEVIDQGSNMLIRARRSREQ